MSLGQALIDLGARYGQHKIQDVLVSRRTLTRTVLPKKYEEIKKNISDIICKNELAFTTDLWTDPYNQRHYLTLTCHYICENFILNNCVLGTREFTAAKKNWRKYSQICAQYFIRIY